MSELRLLRELCNKVRTYRMTPVVDDDFVEARYNMLTALDMVTVELNKDSPKIICLCGSTKFKDEFIRKNLEFTMMGHIVLTVGWFSHADNDMYYPSDTEKEKLDELHKQKIDLCDEVFIINVGGYMGESTKSEFNYAMDHNKPVKFLERPN